jgi:hypothetical protein
MQYHLYNALIGLSKVSYKTEKQARWNAIQQRDNNPLLNGSDVDEADRFVEVIAISKQLTEAERKAWKPEFESAW